MQAGADAIRKVCVLCLEICLFALPTIAQSGKASPTPTSGASWSGVLVSSSCNSNQASNQSPECFKNVPGAKIALYDDINRVMYKLEPQNSVSLPFHLADNVTVRGRLRVGTIHLSSIKPISITQTVEAPHMQLALEQSDMSAVPGTRMTLMAEVRLAPDMHVYAPGAKGYKPIQLLLDAVPEFQLQDTVYPPAKTLFLPAIDERIPVLDGIFRISQDVQVSTSTAVWGSLPDDGKVFTITGKLDYQACDDHMCYLPNSIPVKWQLKILPPETRHK